MYDLDVTMQY